MPRGRPAAPRNIVNPNEIHNVSQMMAEKHTITHLVHAMPDTWSSIQWCARRRLIRNPMICQRCNLECGLIDRGDVTDGKM